MNCSSCSNWKPDGDSWGTCTVVNTLISGGNGEKCTVYVGANTAQYQDILSRLLKLESDLAGHIGHSDTMQTDSQKLRAALETIAALTHSHKLPYAQVMANYSAAIDIAQDALK